MMTLLMLTLSVTRAAVPSWVDSELYPFSPREVSVSTGETLSVVDTGGDGPVVLMVHGTPSWSFLYRDVIRGLLSDHRCVSVDNLGFGLSDKPVGADYSPEAHAERLVSVVNALDLQDAVLVIHDVGGPIGLAVLEAMPERFSGLVVLNTFGWSTADNAQAQRISRMVAGPLGRWLYLKRNASPEKLLPSGFADRGTLSEQEHLHYTAPFPTSDTRHGVWQAGVNLGASADWYGSVWEQRSVWTDKPAEIVWGLSDPWFDQDDLARWEAALPDAPVTRLPGVGHFIAEEQPEAVEAAIRRLTTAEKATR